jgi:hypothetical protein
LEPEIGSVPAALFGVIVAFGFHARLSMPAFWKKRRPSDRSPVLAKTIELAITASVKKSDPLCENFLAVWIEPHEYTSLGEPNWHLKAVQFGKADRDKCAAALDIIVERMQKKYSLKETSDQK